MADNNDDQYLDELLNSLRSSNSDGNEDLDNQDSESNKSRPVSYTHLTLPTN